MKEVLWSETEWLEDDYVDEEWRFSVPWHWRARAWLETRLVPFVSFGRLG